MTGSGQQWIIIAESKTVGAKVARGSRLGRLFRSRSRISGSISPDGMDRCERSQRSGVSRNYMIAMSYRRLSATPGWRI